MTLSKPNFNGQTSPDDFVYAKRPDGTEDASTIIKYKGKSKSVTIPDIILLVATLVQLALLSCSKYYRFIASDELKSIAEKQSSNILYSFDKFNYYADLSNYLDYTSTTIWWVLFVVSGCLKNVSSYMVALAINLPLLFEVVLMAI